MDFSQTDLQRAIVSAVQKVCEGFDADYWLAKDQVGGFPHEFHAAIAQTGCLGVAMPEEYGGAGLGITEAALVVQAISESGAGMSGASAVHMNIFGLHPAVVFGNPEQKGRWLPPADSGQGKSLLCSNRAEHGT
jgi:acyl-CoA dehydrogenase